ncbi:hypothetical protein [Roseibium sp. Sym1]|uniref:hypothetical protein n=1 Tax=Roseibium sp. Sym1 TaxID=3016006 RepID=UPI0022B479CF|nr:hypothetical protein [Roseibium sp. Sym1]
MADQIMDVGEVSTATVNATGTWSWSVSLSNLRGNCVISWSSDAPFRAQQSQVQLIEMPSGNVVATAWATDQAGSWDTGKSYGPGWAARYIAQIGALDQNPVQTVLQTSTSE